MREEIANLVFPAFVHGIHVRERMDRGEELDFSAEQATFKGLLRTELESKRISDFGGDGEHSVGGSLAGGSMMGASVGGSLPGGRGGSSSSRRGEAFFGIRYALVCWIDEMFTIDSPLTDQWNEQKLETALYGTNDRAWRFWEQAKYADARTGTDALEVFYLCVMLGFRGEKRHQADDLVKWVRTAQVRISKGQKQDWPVPADRGISTYVPPLRGREQMQKMIMALAGFILVFIPVLAFIVVKQFLGS